MGYALFACRKVMYTNMINCLELKLDDIMQKKQSLLNFSASISDGFLTSEEVAGDLENYTNYVDYQNAYAMYEPFTTDANGNMISVRESIKEQAKFQTEGMDPDQAGYYIASQLQAAEASIGQDFSKQYEKKLAAIENELDMEEKKIETKLSVAIKQLEAIEQAEGQAIDRATPKYNGVG